LAFHVNVAPHAVLDHNTSTPASALTQFIQILLFVFPAAGRPFSEKSTSHVHVPLSDYRTDAVIRGEIEELNRSPLHCGNYARCVPSQEEQDQSKTPENELWREED
jgi:hypothetical protein